MQLQIPICSCLPRYPITTRWQRSDSVKPKHMMTPMKKCRLQVKTNVFICINTDPVWQYDVAFLLTTAKHLNTSYEHMKGADSHEMGFLSVASIYLLKHKPWSLIQRIIQGLSRGYVMKSTQSMTLTKIWWIMASCKAMRWQGCSNDSLSWADPCPPT